MLTAEEKKERLYKVTGSTAAACLGMNPHMTPFAAWSDIMGLTKNEGNKNTRRGNEMEPLIMAKMAQLTETGLRPAERRSPAPWLSVKADGLLYKEGKLAHVLEVKSVGSRADDIRYYGDHWTSEIPDHHFVQAHLELIAWPEVEKCMFGALLGTDMEVHPYVIERDEEVAQTLMEKLEAWHFKHVVGKTPPEVEAGDYDVIRKITRWPMTPDSEIDPRLEEWATLADKLRHERKDLEKRHSLARAKVASFMGTRKRIEKEWGWINYNPGTGNLRIYMKENV